MPCGDIWTMITITYRQMARSMSKMVRFPRQAVEAPITANARTGRF